MSEAYAPPAAAGGQVQGETTAAPEVALDTYRRLFTEARDGTHLARLTAKKNRRYYDGKVDEATKKLLKRRKQPDFVINRVRPGVEGMVGVVERGKSDPQAYPRNPQDEDASEVATDTLRYISDVNRWSAAKLHAFRNILIEGVAAAIVEVDEDLEVKIRRWRYEEFFYDPHSRELDFSDASYMGGAKWQYVDEVVAAYPDKEAQLRASCARGDVGDATWQDRPTLSAVTWADPQRKRMLVVEMYKRERGTWIKCVFVGDLKLEEGVSPYQDNKGRPCNPIEAQSAYVDDENQRYGHVVDMIGPQDEINVYRRRAAHRATFRQVQETDAVSAYADPEEVRREAARPDGVLPPGYQIVPEDKFQLDIALLQEAKAEIERTQANPAIIGRSASTSGRQDLIRQQAGLTELAHLFAGLEDFELRIWRQCWARVRQFWTQPKFIRVTDDENSMRFIQINEPVWGPPMPVIDPNTGAPQLDPATGQVVMRPQFQGYRNAVSQMDVDIIVDQTPDTANVQQEQYSMLVDLAKVGALGPNPGPILLKASSLPRKREIMEELQSAQPQGPDPAQQQAQQLDLQGRAAMVAKTQGQAAEAHARAAKIAVETQQGGYAPQHAQAAPPPQDPLAGAKMMEELRTQQANTDKTFAQADEARARAAKSIAEAHASLAGPVIDINALGG